MPVRGDTSVYRRRVADTGRAPRSAAQPRAGRARRSARRPPRGGGSRSTTRAPAGSRRAPRAPAARRRRARCASSAASKPGRVATPRRATRSTSFGPLPGQEIGEAVGADEEERLAPAVAHPAHGLERVGGLGPVDVDPRDLGARDAGERCLGEPQPDLRVRRDRLPGRAAGRRARAAGRGRSARCPPARAPGAHVRRVERPAEQPDQLSSSVSSPTTTSSPRLTPAARSARSSSSGSAGGRPATR